MASVARGPLTSLLANAPAQWSLIFGAAYTAFAANPDLLFQTRNNNKSTPNDIPIIFSPNINVRPDEFGGGSSSFLSSATQWVVIGGTAWVAYTFLTHLLPDCMPVTSAAIRKTKQHVTGSLYSIGSAITKQITSLVGRQDDVEQRLGDLDEELGGLHRAVQGSTAVQTVLHEQTKHYEQKVRNAEDRQAYTLRGVQKLMDTVTSLLPPDSPVAKELQAYQDELNDAPKDPENDHPVNKEHVDDDLHRMAHERRRNNMNVPQPQVVYQQQ